VIVLQLGTVDGQEPSEVLNTTTSRALIDGTAVIIEQCQS